MRFRTPFPLLALLFAAMFLAGCAIGPTSDSCNQPNEIATMPAPVADAPCAMPMQSPCTNGLCGARPQAAVGDPIPMMVYGEPGAREHLMTAAQVPVEWTGCIVDGGYKVLKAVVETGNCIIERTFPTPPPSRRYVMFARQPAQMPAAPPPRSCAPPPQARPKACGEQ